MPLKKSGSPEAFKSNLKAEMKAGKPQKQALAIAYSTKRQAMKNKKAKGGAIEETGDDKSAYSGSECPDCYAEGGKCMAHGGDVQHLAEGGRVKDKRELRTKGDDPNHELEASKEETERSEFGYGEMSEAASMHERDAPSAHGAEASLSAEIMRDRKRRGTSKTQGHAEAPQGNVKDLDNADGEGIVDTKKARHSAGPKHGHVPHDDTPSRSKPTSTMEDLYERDDSLRMSQGGMTPIASESYEDDSEMNEESKVGELQGAIDASSHSPKAPDTGEENSEPEDGRDSRGLNLEPVHVMDDPEHDTSEASDQSDYGDRDDSLVGEILRDRKRRRRGM